MPKKFSKSFQSYYTTKTWQLRRKKVLERCDYVCEKCHKQYATDVHHITYERFRKERLSDLLALCFDCHQKEHPDKKLRRFGL